MGTARGVSGLVLLPARDFKWELHGRHTLTVPLKGKISELVTEHELASGVQIAGDDDFSIFEDGIFLVWELVRVLFADAQYPSLKEDECFNVVGLEITDEEVHVHGEVIRAVSE